MKNWDDTENTAMKGYILYAIREWNSSHPEEPITEETEENLFIALNWSTSDKTAQEAYDYYIKYRFKPDPNR